MKRKIFSVLFVLVLVLSFSLIPAVPAAAATPIYVNGATGNDGNNGETPGTAVATIAKGIQLVDTSGTVYVAAGTYDEQVVIGKSLTLQGVGDSTIIKPSQTTADVFQVFSRKAGAGPNENIAPIVVASSSAISVTIKDLKVDGSALNSVPSTAYRSASILYHNCSGKIDSVTVVGIDITNNGNGIWLGSWEYPVTVEVTGCTVSGYNWGGIVADQSTLTVNIHDNTITGRGLTDIQTQNGIQISSGATGTVRHNIISDNSYTMVGTHWDGCGILLGWTANITVEENTIHGCDDGVLLMATNNSTVRNNELTNNIFAGVAFEDGADYNIVTGNQLSNNKAGILVCGPGCTEAEWGYQAHMSGLVGLNNAAHFNNIDGNTSYGVFSPDVKFDATNNWWGDCSGPSGVGPGTGDPVSANVSYDPWLGKQLCALKDAIDELDPEDFTKPKAAPGQMQALLDKIDSVCDQYDDGAYRGAINKLQRDVKKRIEKWIVPGDKQDELIGYVNDEIDILQGFLQ